MKKLTVKKFAVLLTVFALVFSVVGCGFNPYEDQDTADAGESGNAGSDMTMEGLPLEEAPPTLAIRYSGIHYTAFRGAYLWYYDDGYGNMCITSSEASPILLQQNNLPGLTSSGNTSKATLVWSKNMPDKITVKRWSEDAWGQYFAEYTVVFESNLDSSPADGINIPVERGAYIYEIVAQWMDGGNDSTVCYGFYTK